MDIQEVTVKEYFYTSGQLLGRFQLNQNGDLSGTVEYWYKSGQLRFSGTYTNNLPNGILKSWYKNGKLESVTTYKDGHIVK